MASWDQNALPSRPGLYVNIIQAAQTAAAGAKKGTVALPLVSYSGTAVAQKFYEVKSEDDAATLFGAANIQSIKFALAGNVETVLVYTLQAIDGTTVTEQIAYDDARAKFDTRVFNVFVYDGEVSSAEQDRALAWVQNAREEGRNYFVVFGGSATDDQDPTIGNARSVRLKDDYSINLINGSFIDGVEYDSAKYAPVVAGLVASCDLNKSITYTEVAVDEPNRRLSVAEAKTALTNGSLSLLHDGVKTKIEQGITTSGKKIRGVRVQQFIIEDLGREVGDNYIGRVNNDTDGQRFLISMVKLYLETLASEGVLADENVALDPNFESIGDSVYLAINYREVDSLERIFLTINI
jgi:hypothetical protein